VVAAGRPERPLRPTIDLIVQRGLAPAASVAADLALLARAVTTGRGALRVYTLAGEVLAIGRYHLPPEPGPDRDVRVMRRHAGGRVAPWGDGFVGLSLVLPHRAALIASDPAAVRPEQVMNRYLRGLLGACESLGVAAFHPGRDTVTVDGRLLAVGGFEVAASGGFVLEAVVAVDRDLTVLPSLLDRADPGGVVKAPFVTAADTTSLAACTGRRFDVGEIADGLRSGYERRLGVAFENGTVPECTALDEPAWLAERCRPESLDRAVTIQGQLGTVEVFFARAADALGAVVLAGDFIANSPGVDRLEQRLAGAPAEREALVSRILGVVDGSTNFLLGLGTPRAAAAGIADGILG